MKDKLLEALLEVLRSKDEDLEPQSPEEDMKEPMGEMEDMEMEDMKPEGEAVAIMVEEPEMEDEMEDEYEDEDEEDKDDFSCLLRKLMK